MTVTAHEAAAGVSRRAAAHLQNLSNKVDADAKPSNKVDATREKLAGIRKTTEQIVTLHSGFRCTSVLDTPMRRVDVVESINNGDLRIRDTTYAMKTNGCLSVGVTEIHLDYHEAEALIRVLESLTPPEEKQ